MRKAGKSALAEKVLAALHEMAEQGTTTVEAKSGYGLTVDSELKSLAAIRSMMAGARGPRVPTFCHKNFVAAHKSTWKPSVKR